MVLTRNYYNWPDRTLEWTSDGVQRAIELWLADETSLAVTLAARAHQDRGNDRYWRHEIIAERVAPPALVDQLQDLLGRAATAAESWSASDLPFACTVPSRHER